MLTYLTRELTAHGIADRLRAHGDVRLDGNPATSVAGLAAFGRGGEGALSYLSLDVGRKWPAAPAGGTVVCQHSNHAAVHAAAKLVVADARAAMIALLDDLSRDPGIDWFRTLSSEAAIVERGDYEAHPTATVEEPVIIGRGVVLGANVVLNKGTIIGAGTRVGAATVIGSGGAALHKTAAGALLRQPHVGIVTIGANCEIGVHSFVARAMFGATRIGAETRIGNYVNVGHGVSIGERSWIALGALIGGHAAIGNSATLGMGAVVRDGIEIGEGASVGMGSVVIRSVARRSSVFGNPARPTRIGISAGPAR